MEKINVTLNTPVSSINVGEYFEVKVVNTGEIAIFLLADDNEIYFVHDLAHQGDGSEYGRVYASRNGLCFARSWTLGNPSGYGSVGTLIERLMDAIGVEISLCSDNETVAPSEPEDLFSDHYEKREIYSGFHGYHASHGMYMNKPKTDKYNYRIGVELEVEFKDAARKRKFNNMKTNWFHQESDASLGAYGVEIITIPLLPKDAKSEKFWESLVGAIKDDARSWNTGRCGLHVHIGREILGKDAEERSETLGKLLFLYHHYLNGTPLNTSIYGRESAYHERNGKSDLASKIKDVQDETGVSFMKDKNVQKKVGDKLKAISRTDRYFDINISNPDTIEFRKGRGSIYARRITDIVEYSECMCKYARTHKWEDINYEKFVAWLSKNIRKSSHLKDYLSAETNA